MAAVGIDIPLVGEPEMSLPPCVVPTAAETALANVGVRSTVAPRSGFVADALIEAVGRTTTANVMAKGWLVPPLFVAVTL